MQNTLFALSLGFAGLILAVHAAHAAPAQMPLYPSQTSLTETKNNAQVTS